jgi:hypothetical protein
MDFTKFIVNGDNNGLKKYKDDGGDINIVCYMFFESFLSFSDVPFKFHIFGVLFIFTPRQFSSQSGKITDLLLIF